MRWLRLPFCERRIYRSTCSYVQLYESVPNSYTDKFPVGGSDGSTNCTANGVPNGFTDGLADFSADKFPVGSADSHSFCQPICSALCGTDEPPLPQSSEPQLPEFAHVLHLGSHTQQIQVFNIAWCYVHRGQLPL